MHHVTSDAMNHLVDWTAATRCLPVCHGQYREQFDSSWACRHVTTLVQHSQICVGSTLYRIQFKLPLLMDMVHALYICDAEISLFRRR